MKQTLILTTALLSLTTLLSACGETSAVDGKTSAVASAVNDTHGHTPYEAFSAADNEKDSEGNDTHDEHGEDEGDVVNLTEAEAREAGIELSEAKLAEMGQSLSLPAEIRFDADRVANVSPKVSGVVAKLYASEGDHVKRGQTLALISSRDLAGLKAAWQKGETGKALAAQALAREEQLWADKITSEADVQAARAEFEAAKAASDAAENELHAAGVSHEALEKVATARDGDNANSYLTAPISGTIVRRAVTLGQTVAAGDAGADTLFTIADDSVVWADIAVYKQDIGRIRIGAPVALKTDAGNVLALSTVAFVLPVINETSRTATARVIVANTDGSLTPGQFVTADLSVGNASPVVRVPQTAVQIVEDKPSIFVPVEGGFAPKPVMIGATAGGFVEIRSGLAVGETFVSQGGFTLKAQLEKDAFGDGHGH